MIDLSKLNDMNREDALVLAGKMGIQIHHKTGKEKLIEAIKEKAMTPNKPAQDMNHMAAKPVEPVITNTPDEVLAAIADIKARVPVFEACFPDDGTWIFKCKGAEESGNLSIPLRIIKQKAQSVSRGRVAPMALNHMGFDQLGASGNSAYTNTVLS